MVYYFGLQWPGRAIGHQTGKTFLIHCICVYPLLVTRKGLILLALTALLAVPAGALDPSKLLTQYSRFTWTQQHGLPQDAVHCLAQTSDGYLWIGTAEGLARFDGYEFVLYDRDRGGLPSNSITALAAASDGSLWIGTPSGLVLYRNGTFRVFTTKDGLPDNAISAVKVDKSGSLWIAAGLFLSHYASGQFHKYEPQKEFPLRSVRDLAIDRDGNVWLAGLGGIAKWTGREFIHIAGPKEMAGQLPQRILPDRKGNVWIASSQGLMVLEPAGAIRRYQTDSGLPHNLIRHVLEDSDGNIWAGTNGGLARFENGRFQALSTTESRERDLIFSIFEDSESNLWVGSNGGLTRFRDDIFTVYGASEGLPSDSPNSVLEDSKRRVWVGFQNSGLMQFSGPNRRVYTTKDGLPVNEILSLREGRNGDLLIGTPAGLTWMTGDRFRTFQPPDPLFRAAVHDALEDRSGRLWLATPGGLAQLDGDRFSVVIAAGALISTAFGVITESRDGSIWAGTLGRGLWRWKDGQSQHFTTESGLSSNGIRSLYEDPQGNLWIGTFGGGLTLRQGDRFFGFTTKSGLLSNNVLHITDDGTRLWLSTTRGICSVEKAQIFDAVAGKLSTLTPTNYGVQDGLRSAQAGPSHPAAGGGTRTSDGKLWFPTSRGLAVLKPGARRRGVSPPPVNVLAMEASRGGRAQIRFSAIHLRAPELVEYFYRLEGVDKDWVASGSRRAIDYGGLAPGTYKFSVRASLPGGVTNERTELLTIEPFFYQTTWFRVLCIAGVVALVLLIYRVRMQHVRERFRLVLAERARLAREIHDTLAQGYSGIAS